MSSFPLFSRLPLEIRLEVWKLAASSPRIIHLDVSDGESGEIFARTAPHPLLHSCLDSRQVYLGQNGDVVPSGQGNWQDEEPEPKLHTNFERDLFVIRGENGWPMQLFPKRHFIYQLRRIAVDLGSTSHMSSLLWRFFQWQELWIFLGQIPDHLSSDPPSSFKRHCPLHHCEMLSGAYHPSGQPEQYRLPCPACEWAERFYNRKIPYPRYWGNVRITLDSSLPKYPSVDDILQSGNPVLRCIRVSEDKHDIFLQDDASEGPAELKGLERGNSLVTASAAACLRGGLPECCH
jgi:hypothetical protein